MPLTKQEREHFRCTRKRCHVVWQSELLEVTYLNPEPGYRKPGKRGQVLGFTPAARLRMLRTVAAIDWRSFRSSVFITLTYPDDIADRTNSDRNRDRYLFMRTMENHLGRKVGALWRLEWEQRKSGTRKDHWTAHVHMLLFNCRFIGKEIVNDGWQRALNADGKVITWIDGINNGEKAGRYVSKYCGKKADASVLDHSSYLNIRGRHWGVHRRELVPFGFRFHVPFLTEEDIRLCENLAASKFRFFTRGTGNGFSVFGPDARKVGEELLLRDIDREKNLG